MFTKEQISKMKEEEFQKRVLIPLFRKMGFRDVTAFGGGNLERGKDIVMWKKSDLEQRLNFGVVVKAKKITGNAETNEGAMNVLNQIRQMLKTPYLNPVNGESQRIQRCIVACSKEIGTSAMHSIEGELENQLDKLIEWLHPGTNLYKFIDEYLPEQSIFEKLSSVQTELDESMKDTPYRIIANSDSNFSFLGKHDKATEQMPLTLKARFEVDTKTPEGKDAREKFKEHFEKGLPVEIDGKFIKSFDFPEFVPEWMKPQISPEAKLFLSQNPSGNTLPVRILFESPSGETEILEYVEFEGIRKGEKEAVFSNKNQFVPWKIELLFNHSEKKSNFTYSYKTEGFNVYQQLKCLRIMKLLEGGVDVQLTNLTTGIELPKSKLPKAKQKQSSKYYIRLLEELLVIQRKTLIPLSLGKEKLSDAQINEIFNVSHVVNTGKLNVPLPLLTVNYNLAVAKEILGSFTENNYRDIIYKSEVAEEVDILGNKIDLGHFVFLASVYINDEEIKKLNKQILKVKENDTIEIQFTVKDETVSANYLKWLPLEEIEEIKKATFPEIVNENLVGAWLQIKKQ